MNGVVTHRLLASVFVASTRKELGGQNRDVRACIDLVFSFHINDTTISSPTARLGGIKNEQRGVSGDFAR